MDSKTLYAVWYIYIRRPTIRVTCRANNADDAISQAKYNAAKTPELIEGVRPVGIAAAPFGNLDDKVFFRVKKDFAIVRENEPTILAQYMDKKVAK